MTRWCPRRIEEYVRRRYAAMHTLYTTFMPKFPSDLLSSRTLMISFTSCRAVFSTAGLLMHSNSSQSWPKDIPSISLSTSDFSADFVAVEAPLPSSEPLSVTSALIRKEAAGRFKAQEHINFLRSAPAFQRSDAIEPHSIWDLLSYCHFTSQNFRKEYNARKHTLPLETSILRMLESIIAIVLITSSILRIRGQDWARRSQWKTILTFIRFINYHAPCKNAPSFKYNDNFPDDWFASGYACQWL